MGHCFLVRRGVPQGQSPSEKSNSIYPIGANSRPTGNVSVPDNVTSIYQYLFQDDTNVTSISLPNTVDTIPANCFKGCTGLSQINYPTDALTIPQNCFNGCTSLRTVNISENANADSIGTSAFYNCNALKSFVVPNKVRSFGSTVFYGCNQMTTLTIPDSCKVTEIPTGFCQECSRLTAVNIPNTVTTINTQAFLNNKYLAKIELPNALATIGAHAFDGCYYTETISAKDSTETEYDISFPNSLLTIGNYAFQYSMLQNNKTGMKMKISKGLTNIGDYAFCGIANLKDIDVEDNARYSLGARVFSNCYALSDNAVHNVVEQARDIGDRCFEYCTSLKDVHVKYSSNYMFNNCTSLETVTFDVNYLNGASITNEWGYNLFTDCTNLKSVTFTTTYWGIASKLMGKVTSTNRVELYLGDGATIMGSLIIANTSTYTTETPFKKIRLPGTITTCSNSSLTTTNTSYYFLQGGTNLEEIILGEGWSQSVRLNVSSMLTHDSMVETLNNLADLTGKTKQTITFGTANLSRLSAEEKQIATNKNWTIS